MRVLVIGAGGVGGYLAYKLLDCADVTISATEYTTAFIKKNGLKIIDNGDEISVCIKTKVEGIYDVIIVAVKSYSIDDIIAIIKKHSNENTRVLPLLNGIGHFEKFRDFNLKKGCIYILSHKISTNKISKKGDVYLCYEKDEILDELFNNCDFKVKSSENIDVDIWKKYLFIAVFATLTSYYKKPIGWVIENKEDEVIAFAKRVINKAKSLGIELDEEKELNKLLKQAKNIPYDSKTSMMIDFEKNNKTEVDNITGFLIDDEFIKKYYEALNG